MTTAVATGLVLALAASVALNAGFLLQHEGSAEAPAVNVLRPIATLAGLLRQRAWLIGLAMGISGWALHIAALSRAPLSLVQAFVAGGLALLAPIATRWFGHRLRRAEVVAVVAMGVGLALLAVGVHEPSASRPFPAHALAIFLCGCALVAGSVALRRGAAALAVAAGVLYGAADTAIKAITLIDARHGLAHALLSPWLAAAAVATAAAFFAFQRALQLEQPVTSIALMTAATYAISIAAGVSVLGEPIGTGLIGVVHAAAFAAVVAAAWQLAPLSATVARTPESAGRRASTPGVSAARPVRYPQESET